MYRRKMILVAAFLLGLSACGKQNPDHLAESEIIETTESESQQTEIEGAERVEEEKESFSRIMTEAKDMWLNFLDYANGVEQYVVTDLDKNGRAELIISSMGGTGAYTYSRIFEVNEAHDGLEEVTTDFIEGDSQPDIISFDKPVTVYIDQDFVYHYIVEDFLKVTPAEYHTVIYDLTLQEGRLSHRALASKREIYHTEGDVIVTYEDANGAEITEEAYAAIAETVFADANRKEQYIWGWQDLKELKGMSDEEIRQKLNESYCKWEEVWEQ